MWVVNLPQLSVVIGSPVIEVERKSFDRIVKLNGLFFEPEGSTRPEQRNVDRILVRKLTYFLQIFEILLTVCFVKNELI